jgi:hypothetical protein
MVESKVLNIPFLFKNFVVRPQSQHAYTPSEIKAQRIPNTILR